MRSLADYGIGDTELVRAPGFCPEGRLFIKREDTNFAGSIKARTAYFILKDLHERRGDLAGLKLVESTSGNLGIAMARLIRDWGGSMICVVDRTVTPEKLKLLKDAGSEIRMVERDDGGGFPAARIALTRKLVDEHGCLWPNQYTNEAGMMAHQFGTGPEIWKGTGGRVDCVVAAVGTGGTICGVGRFLRSIHPDVCIVGVEPLGSTIFGGESGAYLSAGAGLDKPSDLMQRHRHVIDLFAKVADEDALAARLEFQAKESFGIGVTGAAAVLVAREVARQSPKKTVVAIAADGAQNYETLMSPKNTHAAAPVVLRPPPWLHGRR